MEEDKEILQLKKRLTDLAQRSYQQNCYVFTGFLGLSEQNAFWEIEKELSYAGYELFGGMTQSERKMLRFGREAELGYAQAFPILCIHIEPLLLKFAEPLGHRDFLGALMNLGIERSVLGDLQIGEKQAYLFCQENMAEYICENLDKVKHTHVKCSVVTEPEELAQEEPEQVTIQVASLRLDACIAKVYHLSRSDALLLFRAGKVFVDGRLCENNARGVKGNEVINVRGYGKFFLAEEPKETKKGKLSVTAHVYR